MSVQKNTREKPPAWLIEAFRVYREDYGWEPQEFEAFAQVAWDAVVSNTDQAWGRCFVNSLRRISRHVRDGSAGYVVREDIGLADRLLDLKLRIDHHTP